VQERQFWEFTRKYSCGLQTKSLRWSAHLIRCVLILDILISQPVYLNRWRAEFGKSLGLEMDAAEWGSSRVCRGLCTPNPAVRLSQARSHPALGVFHSGFYFWPIYIASLP
jgi:hypothetical protein